MSAIFQTPGDVQQYTHASAQTAGNPIFARNRAMVACRDLAAATAGSYYVSGIFRVNKHTNAIAAGNLVWWDAGNARADTSGTFVLGVATAAAAGGDAYVYVDLNAHLSAGAVAGAGMPFLVEKAYAGAGTVAIFAANCPVKCRVVDWLLLCTNNVDGTVKLSNGTNDIAAAITHGTTDTAIVRGATIDDAYHDLAQGDTLNLVAATGGNGIVRVWLLPL